MNEQSITINRHLVLAMIIAPKSKAESQNLPWKVNSPKEFQNINKKGFNYKSATSFIKRIKKTESNKKIITIKQTIRNTTESWIKSPPSHGETLVHRFFKTVSFFVLICWKRNLERHGLQFDCENLKDWTRSIKVKKWICNVWQFRLKTGG